MDSSMDDDSSRDSSITTDDSYCTQYEHKIIEDMLKTNVNVVNKITNRQLYGRFAKNPRAKTERIYEKIPDTCNSLLSDVLPEWDSGSAMQHIYMGFTICGQYLLSYTWTTEEDLQSIPIFSVIYYLYVWRYAPGHRLTMVSRQKIFRHYRPQELLDVTFSQWPTDRNKVVAYGVNPTHPADAYITVLFLPTLQNCQDCSVTNHEDDLADHLPCLKHSVTIDFMLNITTPFPVYNPIMHLAYPDHIVINTGHYLHIINVIYTVPPQQSHNFQLASLDKTSSQYTTTSISYSDSQSDISESPSDCDITSKPNIVDAIIQDFSEYDLDQSTECSKPFHELNISCDPLNVTGKNYYSESRIKFIQQKDNIFIKDTASVVQTTNSFVISAQSSTSKPTAEKPKIDKKIAEKAYEFTEENEKCEKLSLFRKKRLADKKYEFSEDNSENIVPFQLLRQERRFLLRTQNRLIRSPDCFVSPRAQGLRSPRSPMLSPNNRSGQSPSSPRNIYCPSLRLSPGSCRSPISPRESARKVNVYSPNHIDSDCSDYETKLVLRQINIVPAAKQPLDFAETRNLSNAGLLIVDGKKIEEKPRWIRKVVKRYCNLDFENASLVSDAQSRDEYLCIDLPTMVHTANSNQIDAVPSRVSDEVIGPHLKVTQRTFDSEQFCQRRAEKLCAENRLKFTHCEDYDIKIQHICPLSGDIVCTAEIKMGAVKEPNSGMELSQVYITNCMFVWNICSDSYRVMESSLEPRLLAAKPRNCCAQSVLLTDLPQIHCKKVRYMAHNLGKSLQYLRDSDNYIQISMDKNGDSGFYMDDFFEDPYQFHDAYSDIDDTF